MNHLLLLTFSPRGPQSCSTQLANHFYKNWHALHPNAVVQRHDMGTNALAGPNQQWLEANSTPEPSRSPQQEALLKASEQYIADLHNATHIVLATPMYNFTLPWHFKAYVDCIVRAGKTFAFAPETGFRPLLSAQKKLLLIWSSAGSYMPSENTASFDFLTPYVRHVFGFMGITNVQFVAAGQQWGTPEQAQAQIATAKNHLTEIATTW